VNRRLPSEFTLNILEAIAPALEFSPESFNLEGVGRDIILCITEIRQLREENERLKKELANEKTKSTRRRI